MVLRIAALVLIACGLGFGEPIIFTIQGVGTGTVNSTPFTDAAFTFTVTTDTTLIETFTLTSGDTGFETPEISGADISISGIGPGTFADPEQIFLDHTLHRAGITDFLGTDPIPTDLLDGVNASFAPYDLQSSIGPLPLTDLVALDQFVDIPTSLGGVTFTLATDVFFTADTFVSPEPGTFVLAAGALLLAGVKFLARAR